MAVANGTLTKIYISGVAVACSTNVTLTVNGETIDTTNKDSGGWEANIAGKKNWAMSGDFVVDDTSTIAPDDLLTLLINGTYSAVKYMNNTSTAIYYEGSGKIDTFNLSAGTEAAPTGSFSIKGTGVLSVKTLT